MCVNGIWSVVGLYCVVDSLLVLLMCCRSQQTKLTNLGPPKSSEHWIALDWVENPKWLRLCQVKWWNHFWRHFFSHHKIGASTELPTLEHTNFSYVLRLIEQQSYRNFQLLWDDAILNLSLSLETQTRSKLRLRLSIRKWLRTRANSTRTTMKEIFSFSTQLFRVAKVGGEQSKVKSSRLDAKCYSNWCGSSSLVLVRILIL